MAEAKPFDPVEFLAFVKGKPGDEEYDWLDPHECACGQFATSLGWDGDLDSVWRADLEGQFGKYAIQFPRTWSALASRLESLLAEQGETSRG